MERLRCGVHGGRIEDHTLSGRFAKRANGLILSRTDRARSGLDILKEGGRLAAYSSAQVQKLHDV